jgi:hypothetical protein
MNAQHFWLANSYLGSRQIGNAWIADEQSAARRTALVHHHLAYFCQYCGTVWGRVTYDYASPRWQICVRACAEHGMIPLEAYVAGSLQSTYPGSDPLKFARDWPRDAMKWEADLLLRKAELGLLNLENLYA